MDKNILERYCKYHIEELDKRLIKIYTINEQIANKQDKEINVMDELAKLKYCENIYSVIEKEGISEGTTYEEYIKYLTNTRKSIEKYEKIKSEIEKVNITEIKNINILLKTFKRALKELNNV